MTTIFLESALMQRVEDAATAQTIQPEALIDAAVRTYLRQLDRERIKAEAQAFQTLHATLVQQYLGQYVAIYNKQLVDHDPEMEALHSRIRQKYGSQPVLLRRVELQPERELTFRSPRIERR